MSVVHPVCASARERGFSGISGGHLPLEEYIARVEQVTLDDVIRCAGTVKLHTVYFLKGVEA